MAAPVIDEIANEMQNEIKVGKVNVDEEPKLAEAFNVTGIPTFLVINNGKLINQMVGARSKEEILEMIKK